MDRLDGTSPKRARKDMADGQQQPPKRRRTLGIMPLEPRIMYDGAAAATAAAASTAPHDAPAADAGRNAGPAPQDASSAPAERPSGVPTDHASALQVPTFSAPTSDASDAGSAGQHATAPSAIVFIDGSVPDLQDLVNGAKPGETVVVLDPAKDGVQQIADYLAANDVHGLAAIQIVSHGLEGEVNLGSTTLTDLNLADHANALAGIGAALAPGGDILLYGCYVGHGDAGQQFVKDLASLTGANIAASSAPIGATTDGVNWNLDVSTGPIEATVPFTAAALQSFAGTLPVTIDGQLFYRINNGPDNGLGHINTDGSNQGTFYLNPSDAGSAFAVDPAAGLIFTPGRTTTGTGSYDSVLVISATSPVNFATHAGILATASFGPHTGSGATDDVVMSTAIDPINHILYVSDWGTNETVTGVRQFTYNPLNGALTPVATNGGFLFTAAQTETTPGNAATTQFTNAQAMYVDTANHLLYYVDDDAGFSGGAFHSTNAVYVVSTTGVGGFHPTQLTSLANVTGGFPAATVPAGIGVHGDLVGLAVDVADGKVFFETTDVANSANNALWWVSTTNNAATETANQIAHKVNLPAGVTLNFAGQVNDGGLAAGLSFDAQTKQIYLTNAFNSGDSSQHDLGSIYVLQWNNATQSVSLVKSFDTAALVGPPATPATVSSVDAPSATNFDILPVLTVAGTATHATEQGSFIDLTASNTSSDQDGGFYASATVQITGGTFTSNETSANDDHLAVLDGGVDKTSGKFAGTNITIAYDAANEKLTLTGYDSIANYNAALAAVEYKTTGDNPTNYGNNTSRTISWTVSDGAQNVPFGAQNSGTTTLNIDAVNDAPVNHLPASPSLNEDAQTAITGISVTDVDADPANHDITVTLSVAHGTLNVLTNVANGIVAADITGGAQDSNSITITATQNQINATLGANGLRYLGALNYNGPETLHIVTNDNGHTGTPGAQTDTDDLSVTVLPVNDPPNLQPDSTTATAYTENAAPTALFAGESINSPLPDVDNSANYAGGSLTVSVTGGAVSGDQIVLLGSSPFHISGANLQDAGNNNIGAISGTGTGTVTVSALTALATPTVVNQLAQAFGFQSTSDDPGAGDRTITETFNDGGNTGSGGAKTDSVTQTVHITPVNDAPTLSATATNSTFTEAAGVGTQAAAVPVFSGANASTIEAGQSITELDFTVSGLQDGANEKIVVDGTTIALDASSSGTTATNGMAYTVTVLGGNATIALTKAAGVSVANLDALINGITYQDTNTDSPTAGGRVFTLASIKDNGGTLNGGADTTALAIASTVTVVPTNDAPAITGDGNTVSYAEQTPAILVDSGITLSDVDSPNLVGATVTILGLQSGDTLHFTNQNGISGSYSGGVLTLTGTATVAQYQAALRSVTFDNLTNDNPTNGELTLDRTVQWQVNDGGAVANLSNTGTTTITVTAVNDPPALSVSATAAYTENAPPTTLDSGLSVTDVDGGFGYSATVQITGGFVAGDQLAGGGTYNAATHTFTTNLAPNATITALQADLQTLTFSSTSDNPGAGPRTLTWTISDGSATAATFVTTSTVNVTPVNDAPVLANVGPGITVPEQTFATLDSNATASDVELNGLNLGNGDYSGATLTIARHLGANAQDAFSFNTIVAAFTVSGNELQAGGQTFATFASAGGVLTIDFTSSGTTATSALVNNVIQHITYANQSDAPPASVTLDYTFNDGNTNGAQGTGGALTASGSTIVTITAVNDAPVNTVPGAQSAAENTNLVFDTAHSNAISVSDADAAATNITVTLSVGHGTLTVPTNIAGGLTAAGIGGNNSAIVTLTGPQAAIDATLAAANGLTYHPDLNFVGSDTLTVLTNDNGHTPAPAKTATSTVAINVAPTTPGALDGQLSFLINNGTDSQAGHVNSDGSNATMVYANNSESTIAVDTAAGLIFTTNAANAAFEDTITVHSALTGAVLATLQLGGGFDVVTALTIDPFTHTLYAADWGNDETVTGVKTISYNPLTGALTDNGFLFTAAQTETTAGVAATTQFTNAQALYYDHAHELLYYADNDGGYNIDPFHPTNGVYVVSTAAGSLFQPTELTSAAQFPTDDSNGYIDGLTVDVAHNTVYFLTTDTTGSVNNALWWIDTTAAGQTATQIALPADTLNFAGQVSGEPGGLSFDAQTRQLYVSNQERDPGIPDLSSITQLQLDATGHAVTSFKTFDVASLVGSTPAAVDPLDTAGSTSFDILPVLTVSGTTTHAAEQGGFVDLTTSSTSTDQDGGFYAGATAQITGGTFSSNETSATDDHLAVLDGGVDKTSGTFTGTNISFAYDSTTEKLTLSGYDTIANYNTVLAAVEYKTTGDNPTNSGLNTTRTISWTVSDGAQNIPFGAQNSGTTTLTIDATDDAPVNTVPPGQSVLEDHSLAITGVSVSDVDANPASDIVQVTLGVTHGTLTVANNVLTGPGAITGNGTGSVVLTGTLNDINTTLGEANGLLYGPNPNFNGSDQLTVTTNDQGHTGSGGPLTDTDTVAINVISVNDAPAGADTTVSTQLNTPHVFTAGEFGFSDPNDNPANAFQAVKITTTPLAGSLTDNGVTVAAGQFVTVADINAGKLVFTPANGGSGADYADFTFQVQDNGGTANGGQNLDPTPNKMTIDVSAKTVSITGTAQEGQTLTANPTGDPGATFTYQWQSSSDNGATFQNIAANSTSQQYTLTEADEFKLIRVETTFIDGGSTVVDSAPTTAVADALSVLSGPTVTGVEGAAFSNTVVTFTDADPNGSESDLTATIDWGDGTTSAGTVTQNGGVFSVAGTHTYAEEGSYTPVVSISDEGHISAQFTGTATIADAALIATGTTLSGTEGAALTQTVATFTDANPNATVGDFTATINWGDGTTTTGTVTGIGGVFSVAGTHTYAEEGSFTPVVSITDIGGSTALATGTATIADAALTATGATLSGTEGAALTQTVATFTDANPNATVGDFTATINWGDGTTTTGTVTGIGGVFSVAGTHTYADEGVFTPVVSITDIGGSTAQASDTATIADAALAAAGTTFSGTEGAAFTQTVATFTDANPNGSVGDFTATINWGDGSPSTVGTVTQNGGVFGVAGAHTYAEEGTYTSVVSITDIGGSTAVSTSTAIIADAALTATGATLSGTEGTALTQTVATFIDANPNAPVGDFTATIDWGDGSPSTVGTVTQNGGVFSVSGTHTYADEGSFTPVVSVTDIGGSTAQATGTATIADAALTATGTTLSGTEGTALAQTVATFTDANPNATVGDFTATINWGDGTTSPGTVIGIGGGFSVAGTHTYADEGVFTPVVSITDIGGSTAQASSTATIADNGDLVATLSSQSPVEGSPISVTKVTDGGIDVQTDLSFVWKVNGAVATGAGQGTATYTPTEADEGQTLSVVVTYTGDVPSGESTTTTAANTVQDIVPTVTTPVITGIAQEGQILTSSVATTNDADAVVHYQWEKSTDGFATFTLVGSDSKTYAVTEADEGFAIRVVATTSDADNPGAHATAASAATAAVIDIDPTITAPTIVVTGQQGPTATLTAVGAVTNDSDAVIHYQWLESHGNGPETVIGTDSATYVTQPGDQGGTIRVRVFTTDADNPSASAQAFSTNSVHGNDIVAPPTHDNDHGHGEGNGNDDHGGHGNSFGMVTNVQANGGFPGFSGLGFTPGSAVYAVHADLDPTVGLDGKLDFKLPLLALEAPLGGDIVSVTATLADGQPLPSWLHFDPTHGQFAGLVPDNLLTGSLPPTAGGVPGGGAGTGAMAVPDTLTIEVVARNSKGDISILEFTIDLTGKNPIKTGRHGWNLPNGRTFDPWAIERQRGGLAAHRDVAIPASWDGASDALPHGRGHDADRPGGHHVPAGRAGLSAQLATLGTRGIDAGRTALLDSLRHARL